MNKKDIKKQMADCHPDGPNPNLEKYIELNCSLIKNKSKPEMDISKYLGFICDKLNAASSPLFPLIREIQTIIASLNNDITKNKEHLDFLVKYRDVIKHNRKENLFLPIIDDLIKSRKDMIEKLNDRVSGYNRDYEYFMEYDEIDTIHLQTAYFKDKLNQEKKKLKKLTPQPEDLCN
jgi:hypothetical protein